MTAGMIPPGMGHRPPAMGMGPFGGGGGVPMMGMQQGMMGMNPAMNPGMMGMNPMMVSRRSALSIPAYLLSGPDGRTIHATWHATRYDAWHVRNARNDGRRSDRATGTQLSDVLR